MKKIIALIAFSFCGILVYSQGIYVPVNPTVYGTNNNRIKSKFVIGFPSKDTTINTTDSSAQIFYRPQDSTWWSWSKEKGFLKFGSGSGTGSLYSLIQAEDSSFTGIKPNSGVADTLVVVAGDGDGSGGGSVGNYHLPYNGNSKDYLGGDTMYHSLPNSWNMSGDSANSLSFLGTLNDIPLKFKVNNENVGVINQSRNNVIFTPNSNIYDNAVSTQIVAIGDATLNSLTNPPSPTFSNGTVAIGANIMPNAISGQNTSVGGASMLNLIDGTGNSGLGINNLFYNKHGNYNTALGNSALFLTKVSNNYMIGLGYNAGTFTGGDTATKSKSNTLYVSDSTYHKYMQLDSAEGSAPNVIGKDSEGFWHVYQIPSGSEGVTQDQLDDTAQAIRADSPKGIIESGTYIPTYWGLSNLSFPGGATDGRFFYSRIDSIVTVSGLFTSVPTSNAKTVVTFSLPIPSNFTQSSDVAGSVGGGFSTLVGGLVEADYGNDGITVMTEANGTGGGRTWAFTCQYIIK